MTIATIDPFAEEGPDAEVPGPEEYIDRVFGDGGYLAGRFEGYQPRRGQVALARSVDEAIRDTKHLMAEGPTGTGKSIGYAVPASYHAAMHGRRVVIVTANIALQEQLVQKDLPLLEEILPWRFSFASLKGRSNYLCIDRMLQAEADRMVLFGGRSHDGSMDDEELERVRSWAQETETGDVSELDFVPDGRIWRDFSRGPDECKGNQCKQFVDCHAYAAKRKARDAMIVVTNYHMLFAHTVVRRLFGKNLILPGFDIAILDEAHKASDIARDFFGFRASGGTPARLAKALEKLKGESIAESRINDAMRVAAQLRRSSSVFFNAIAEYKRRGGYRVRLKEVLAEHATVGEPWKAIDRALDLTTQIFSGLSKEPFSRDKKAEFSKLSRRSADARSNIENAMLLEEDEENVYFLEEEFGGGKPSDEPRISISSKPIRVDKILHDELFEGRPRSETTSAFYDEDDEPSVDEKREQTLREKRSVICTSATLSTADRAGPFAYIAREMGCAEHLSIIAESPFDWERQCLFIVPTGMPDPSDRETFAKAVPDAVAEVISRAKGRTLALFTSYKALNSTHEKLAGGKRAQGQKAHTLDGYRVLKQGEMPRGKLVQIFKEDVSSVLLGTESFWAGVDVPGEALSCVVIDKLPFATPEDPVLDAIASKDKNWFFNHSIPRAIIQFKQGFGRLIRSMSDRGVVVLLDNRVVEKGYGAQFIKALPDVSRSRKIEHLNDFLGTAKPAKPVEAEEAYYGQDVPF